MDIKNILRLNISTDSKIKKTELDKIETKKEITSIIKNKTNKSKNPLQISNQNSKINSNVGLANGVTIAKRNEPGYMKMIDMDNDGIITLDEFNQYCKENSIDGENKQKLFMAMTTATAAQKNIDILKEKKEREEKESSEDKEDATMYAQKGDAKYQEEMDTNNDGKVSQREYLEYKNKHNSNKTKTNADNKADDVVNDTINETQISTKENSQVNKESSERNTFAENQVKKASKNYLKTDLELIQPSILIENEA